MKKTTEPSIRHRAARRATEERGSSLVELIVAISLFAMLGTMLVGMFASFSGAFSRDRAASDSTSVAAVAMNELTRVIRSGTEIPEAEATLNKPVFMVAEDDHIVMHAFLDTDALNPAPILVEFAIGDTTQELVETRWNAKEEAGFWKMPSRTSAPASERTIARQIVPRASGEPYLFTYLDAEGGTLPFTNEKLSDADLRKVAAVQITMRVQADAASGTKPAVLQNTVGIPNLGVARVGL